MKTENSRIMQNNTVASIGIRRVTHNISTFIEDQLAIEEPLEIQLAYNSAAESIIKVISVTMRTPGNDEELAAGFLFTEGIIKQNAWISKIEQREWGCNRIRVNLYPHSIPVLQKQSVIFILLPVAVFVEKRVLNQLKLYRFTNTGMMYYYWMLPCFAACHKFYDNNSNYLNLPVAFMLQPCSTCMEILSCFAKMLAATMRWTN
jgi:hypothetical protein